MTHTPAIDKEKLDTALKMFEGQEWRSDLLYILEAAKLYRTSLDVVSEGDRAEALEGILEGVKNITKSLSDSMDDPENTFGDPIAYGCCFYFKTYNEMFNFQNSIHKLKAIE